MKRSVVILLVALALLIAAAAGFFAGAARGARSHMDRGAGADSEFVQLLMGRVSTTFVARDPNLHAGAAFLVTPKPLSDVLCRVDRFQFPEKVVLGRQTRPEEYWDDDLEITRWYGIWRLPSDPPVPPEASDEACPKYRDFNNLIRSDDSSAVGRVVQHLSLASEQAERGRVDFDLTCEDKRERPQTACNPLELLRDLDLRKIRSVSTREVDDNASLYVDTAGMAFSGASSPSCGNIDLLTFTLTTTGPYHMGDKLRSIRVEQTTIC